MPGQLPQLWTTGPALIYAGAMGNAPSAAIYVGTCESKPEIDIRPYYSDVKNDLGGAQVPMDRMFDGQDALITCDLTRWIEASLDAVVSLPNVTSALNGNTSDRGFSDPGDIGTLCLTELQAAQIYIVFPYQAKGALANQKPGYRFPGCLLEGETWTSLGTKPKMVRLMWHALRVFDPTKTNSYGMGRFTLYDFGVAGLPAAA